jgi:hypothetical protein
LGFLTLNVTRWFSTVIARLFVLLVATAAEWFKVRADYRARFDDVALRFGVPAIVRIRPAAYFRQRGIVADRRARSLRGDPVLALISRWPVSLLMILPSGSRSYGWSS